MHALFFETGIKLAPPPAPRRRVRARSLALWPPPPAGSVGGRALGPALPRNVYPAAPPRRQAAMQHDAAGAAEASPPPHPPRGPPWRPSPMTRLALQRPTPDSAPARRHTRTRIRPAAAPRSLVRPRPSPAAGALDTPALPLPPHAAAQGAGRVVAAPPAALRPPPARPRYPPAPSGGPRR